MLSHSSQSTVIESNTQPERRTESHKRIRSLVRSRTETLAMYSKLAQMQPFTDSPETPRQLQRFCQALIDYTAGAHFVLYKYIDDKTERRKPVSAIASQIYPKIVDMTQSILDFNDKYDCENHCDKLDDLAQELSRLGEALADRIELEDELIDVLTKSRGK